MVDFLPVVAENPVLKEVGEIPVLPLQPQPDMVLQHLQMREKNVSHGREKAGIEVFALKVVLDMLLLRRKKY
jgi:hypothetical protein